MDNIQHQSTNSSAFNSKIHPDHDPFITALTHYTVITITGPDAQTFLHGQLSCDMTTVTETQAKPALYCSAQGRLLATSIVFKVQDGYGLLLPTDISNSIAEKLQFYGQFSKITLTNTLDAWTIIAVHSTLENTLLDIAWATHINDTSIWLRWHDAPNSYLLLTPSPAIAQQQWQALTKTLANVPATYWDWQLISAGFPMILASTQDTFLPHRLNYHLLGAIDFNKGCYIGQEIISRMHYRAKLKFHTYRCQLDKDLHLSPGDPLYTTATLDKPIGHVVNYSHLAEHGTQLLLEFPVDIQRNTEIYNADNQGALLCELSIPYSF